MVYFNLWEKIFDLLNTRESVIEFARTKYLLTLCYTLPVDEIQNG
jgi:hypothetical protein